MFTKANKAFVTTYKNMLLTSVNKSLVCDRLVKRSLVQMSLHCSNTCNVWPISFLIRLINCLSTHLCTADAANGVRDQDGALEGPSATVNGGSETPSTARSRVVRQAAPPSAGPAPSPSFAAADSGALRSYNLK